MDKTTHRPPFFLIWRGLSRSERFYYDMIFKPAVNTFWWSCIRWYGSHNTPPIHAENAFWGAILPHSPSIANLIGIREFTAGIERAARNLKPLDLEA